jgi:hypothetical protein
MMVVIAITIFVGSYGMSQTDSAKVKVEFPGACLKWIHAAEPEFQRRHLDENNYIIYVHEKDDSVVITLGSPDEPKGVRGSVGTYPGYEVEISKKDLKILRSNYIR